MEAALEAWLWQEVCVLNVPFLSKCLWWEILVVFRFIFSDFLLGLCWIFSVAVYLFCHTVTEFIRQSRH